MTGDRSSMYDVFISHSSQDTDVVNELADQLRTQGVTVFPGIATLQAGEDWRERVSSALENARALVVVLSSGSSAEGFVTEEVAIAQKNAREGSSLLIPVLIGDVDRITLPRGLEKFHAVRAEGLPDLPKVAQLVANAVRATEPSAEVASGDATSTPASAAPLERTLADYERTLEPGDPSIMATRANLASVYQALGRYAEAAELLERTLADCGRVLGPDHPSTLTIRANLAGTYQDMGRTNEAAALLERTLADSERILGTDHVSTLTVRGNLAHLLQRLGRYKEAAELLERTLADSERILGADHTSTLRGRANLATIYFEMGETGKAAALLEDAVAHSKRVLGPDHTATKAMQENLSIVERRVEGGAHA
jgi:tetratricopeptide (TPR) repeat protein